MRKISIVALTMLALFCGLFSTAHGQFSEGFDVVTDLTPPTLTGDVTASGMFGKLQSDPIGSTGIFQGNDTVFPAQSGPSTSYAGMNFNNTSGSDIATWLMTPELTIQDGDTWSFWTRTATGNTFPDRADFRLSTAGASTDTGTSPTDVGDFTDVLVEINPTLMVGGYPDDWMQFTGTISGVGSTSGRLAFRYNVTDAGPTGNNSNYIGLDTFEYTSIPEPGSLTLLGLSLAGALFLRRRRS
jgi:hypothetical protein